MESGLVMKEVLLFQVGQQEINGLKPDAEPTKKPDIPTVLRDTGGRVRWNLHGNTPEENEQIGIRNVQGVFLEAFPEFLERFPFGEDGKITEDRKEEAMEFIVNSIGSYKMFRGRYPLN